MEDPLDLVRDSKYECFCLSFSGVHNVAKSVCKLNENNGALW